MNRFLHLMAVFATFAPDDDKGGGAGGKKPDDKTDDEKLIRMVNAATTSQLERKLEAAVSAALAPIIEKISALESGGKKPDDKTDDDSESPAMKKLLAEMESLKAQNLAKDTAAAATVKKHREEQLVAQIREGLSKAGVKPELLEGATSVVRGKMKIDEGTGEVSYTKQNAGWTDSLDVTGGLKDWCETDAGKAHMAPLTTGGAGTKPIGGGRTTATLNPATLPDDPKARAQIVKAHKLAVAKEQLRHHTSELMAGGRVQIAGTLPTTGGGE